MTQPLPVPEISDTELAYAVMRLARRLRVSKGPRQLPALQVDLLRILRDYPDACAREIAGGLNLTHAPISRSLAALRRNGLIVTQSSRADRRMQRHTITRAGMKALDAVDPMPSLERELADLHVGDRSNLYAMIDRLGRSLP